VAMKVPEDCIVDPVKTFEEANALLKSLTKGFIVEKRDINKITSATQMLTGYIARKVRQKTINNPPIVGKHRFDNSGFRGRGFRGRGGGFRGRGNFRGRGFRSRGRGGFRSRGGSETSRGRGRGRARARGGNFGYHRDVRNEQSSFAGPRSAPQRFGRGRSFQADGPHKPYDHTFNYSRGNEARSADWR